MMKIVCLILSVMGSLVVGEMAGQRRGGQKQPAPINNGPAPRRQQAQPQQVAKPKPQQQVARRQQQQPQKPQQKPQRQLAKMPQGLGRHHHYSSSSSSSSSHYVPPTVPKPCKDCNKISAVPDTGFYSFPYTGANTWSPRSFTVCNQEPVRLTVTGCFCPGDYFEVFDNGVPILITDQDNFPGWSTTCDNPVNDPAQCIVDTDFAKGEVDLPAGSHNLTIWVGASWYTGGAGFLRLDTLCTFDAITQPCCAATQSCPNFIVA